MKKYIASASLIIGVTLLFASCSTSNHAMDDGTHMEGDTHSGAVADDASHAMDNGKKNEGRHPRGGQEKRYGHRHDGKPVSRIFPTVKTNYES